MSSDRLNVIALISGGKDSFFSLLHCLHHGHRVVALANLFPAVDGSPQDFQVVDPAAATAAPGSLKETEDESKAKDLNSFMYQTVGHEIIPLYAAATGLPVYRQPIVGGALHHERDYDCGPQQAANDETESMVPLLKGVMSRHPEANALCAGAILSTYQRTRVESVALRLGLTPLAYLWKYPILPRQAIDDAQLLRDMAESGLEAHIIKVASAGLGEQHLWQRVSSVDGAEQVKRALRKFGAVGGAVLGEGGEFETVVVDGPSSLFKKRINVPDSCRKVVQEGGGSTWLLLGGASLEDKPESSDEIVTVPTPELFDDSFQAVLDDLSHPSVLEMQDTQTGTNPEVSNVKPFLGTAAKASSEVPELLYWSVLGVQGSTDTCSIEEETAQVADKIRQLLDTHGLNSDQISNTVVIIRRMADFPKVNAVYGQLFKRPNPPARVTVSCGDLLPPGCNVAVHITISPSQPSLTDRQGLHVQSRSYWAPANIGPYSQAVGIRVVAQNEATSLRTWSIAGQIPLIPYSMELPVESPTSTQLEIVLSLQHLWRIALDMKIQTWASAVAFFAAKSFSSSESQLGRKAQLAARAWRLAHGSPDDAGEAEAGPDPWDLKYNPQFMSLSGEHAQSTAKSHLPDWEVFTLRQQNEPESCIPPCFAVEVEELPKQSEVEWHAHTGLSQVEESSVELGQVQGLGASRSWTAWHTIAKTSTSAFIHTVVARELPGAEQGLTFSSFEEELAGVYREVVQHLRVDLPPEHQPAPYLTYMDVGAIDAPWVGGDDQASFQKFALLPCRSVWSSEGKRLGAICLYRTVVAI